MKQRDRNTFRTIVLHRQKQTQKSRRRHHRHPGKNRKRRNTSPRLLYVNR